MGFSSLVQKRRSVALGCVSVGSSVGGIVLPIVTRRLLPRVGYPWTLRILGFILLATILPGNLLLRRRLPPRDVRGGLINWAELKKPQIVLYLLAKCAALFGLYVPLTYLDISAQNVGVSSNLSFYLISIANGGSLIGRIGGGLLADKFGAMNILIPFTFSGAIIIFAWPHATSIDALAVVALLYGICSGAFVSLTCTPVSMMGGMEDVGRRIGMATTVGSMGGVAGPPIAGAIRTSSGGLQVVGVYAGLMVLMSAALLLAARRAHLGTWKGRF